MGKHKNKSNIKKNNFNKKQKQKNKRKIKRNNKNKKQNKDKNWSKNHQIYQTKSNLIGNFL